MKTNTASFQTVLKAYWRYAMTQPVLFFTVMVGTGLGKFTVNILFSLYVGRIIDTASSATSVEAAWPVLMGHLWGLAGICLVYMVGFRVSDFSMTRFQTRVLRHISEDVFTRMTRKSHAFFASSFTGSLVAKIKRYVNGFETLHDRFIYTFWEVIVVTTGLLVGVALEFPFLAVGFAAWIGIFVVIVSLYVQWKAKYDAHAAETDSQITAVTADAITNVLAVKTCAQEPQEHQRFSAVAAAREKALRWAWDLSNFQWAGQNVLISVLELGVIYYLLTLWRDGVATVGEIVTITGWMFSLTMALWEVGRGLLQSGKALSESLELQEMLDTAEALPEVDAQNAHQQIHDSSVKFTGVTFAHGGNPEPIFHDFNLTLKPGEKVGLVGHSGAGKSTLTGLLLRLYDVQSGSVSLGGVDIRTLPLATVRESISYVPQTPLLFHRTIAENIAYGAPNAPIEAIQNAAQMAHAHDFILSLPQGYDTLVGERGVKLSGGQRQRIAIARAFLKPAPIVVLDEATSSLDSASEAAIEASLTPLLAGKTALVIAHRLSTLRAMDRLIVMDQGKIIEQGTHDELLTQNGTYAELWAHQSRAATNRLVEG